MLDGSAGESDREAGAGQGHDSGPQPAPGEGLTSTAEQTAVGPDGMDAAGEPPATEPDATGVLPPVVDTPGSGGAPPPPPERWSARAKVPTHPADADAWDVRVVEPPRGLLLPLLIAVCVLLLAAVVALGVWLALRGGGPGPGPQPSTTSTTKRTTSPSKTAPSTTPPTSAPVTVTIPDERGKDAGTATSELEGMGLVVVTTEVNDPDVPAGQVIGTSPAAGTVVAQGSSVTVQVSLGTATESPTVPPTTPPPTSLPPTS
jgi:eukaryotic-like serine/threonine-protein kinase